MAKRLEVELPDRVYDELTRVGGDSRGIRREVVAAVRARLSERRRRRRHSILSLIGIGEGDPKVSQQVDEELYGPLRCK